MISDKQGAFIAANTITGVLDESMGGLSKVSGIPTSYLINSSEHALNMILEENLNKNEMSTILDGKSAVGAITVLCENDQLSVEDENSLPDVSAICVACLGFSCILDTDYDRNKQTTRFNIFYVFMC